MIVLIILNYDSKTNSEIEHPVISNIMSVWLEGRSGSDVTHAHLENFGTDILLKKTLRNHLKTSKGEVKFFHFLFEI